MADEGDEQWRTALGLLGQHLGLAASLLAAAWVALQVLVLARGNPQVATSIVASADTGTILLVSLMVFMTYVLAVGAAFAVVGCIRLGRRARAAQVGIALAALFVCVVAIPAATLVLALATVAIAAWREGDSQAEVVDRSASSSEAVKLGVGVIALVAFVGVLNSISSPDWLVAERLTVDLDSKKSDQIVFVLDSDDHLTTVLTNPERTVARLETKSIVDRQVCDLNGRLMSRSVWSFIAGGSTLESCDEQ